MKDEMKLKQLEKAMEMADAMMPLNTYGKFMPVLLSEYTMIKTRLMLKSHISSLTEFDAPVPWCIPIGRILYDFVAFLTKDIKKIFPTVEAEYKQAEASGELTSKSLYDIMMDRNPKGILKSVDGRFLPDYFKKLTDEETAQKEEAFMCESMKFWATKIESAYGYSIETQQLGRMMCRLLASAIAVEATNEARQSIFERVYRISSVIDPYTVRRFKKKYQQIEDYAFSDLYTEAEFQEICKSFLEDKTDKDSQMRRDQDVQRYFLYSALNVMCGSFQLLIDDRWISLGLFMRADLTNICDPEISVKKYVLSPVDVKDNLCHNLNINDCSIADIYKPMLWEIFDYRTFGSVRNLVTNINQFFPFADSNSNRNYDQILRMALYQMELIAKELVNHGCDFIRRPYFGNGMTSGLSLDEILIEDSCGELISPMFKTERGYLSLTDVFFPTMLRLCSTINTLDQAYEFHIFGTSGKSDLFDDELHPETRNISDMEGGYIGQIDQLKKDKEKLEKKIAHLETRLQKSESIEETLKKDDTYTKQLEAKVAFLESQLARREPAKQQLDDDIQDIITDTLRTSVKNMHNGRTKSKLVAYLDGNKDSSILQTKRDYIKALFSDFKGADYVITELKRLGFIVERAGSGHFKLSMDDYRGSGIVISATPSDHRTGKNTAAAIINEFF